MVEKVLTQYLNFPPAQKNQKYVGDINLSHDIRVYINDNRASWFEGKVKYNNKKINSSGVNI
jgi:hypothetical protein